MNDSTEMHEACAEELPSAAAQLIAFVRNGATHDPRTEQERLGLTDAEYATALQNAAAPPRQLSGYLPDGALRPNGLWIAELDARDDNKARRIAFLEGRAKWHPWIVVAAFFAGAMVDAVIGRWL